MKNLFKATLAVLASSVAMYGTPAKAGITEYTTQASFNAAITETGSPITFEGTESYNASYPATSYSTGYATYDGTQNFGTGVDFTDPDGLYAVTTGFGDYYNDTSTSLVADGNGSLTVAPIASTGVTALGTQIFSGSYTALTDEVEVFLVGNTSSTPDASYSVSANLVDDSTPTSFIGFTTTTGSIGSVVFEHSGGDSPQSPLPIDNLEIGVANPAGAIPEPSTYACVLLGGALLFLFNRRKSLNA